MRNPCLETITGMINVLFLFKTSSVTVSLRVSSIYGRLPTETAALLPVLRTLELKTPNRCLRYVNSYVSIQET